MAKQIGEYAVHLRDEQGELHTLLPGDDVPEWAVPHLGEHVFATAVAAPEPDPEAGSVPAPAGPPPRAGRGSSAEAWADYALDHDVEVDDGQSRDEIIAACEKAGVPT